MSEDDFVRQRYPEKFTYTREDVFLEMQEA